MGFRINTAIGWGMPFDRFVEHLTLPDPGQPDEDGWLDHLEEVLSHTQDMRGPPGWPLPITGEDQTVLDLMRFVGYDEWSDVVLMPSAGEARTWTRSNDDLDYALQWGPRGPRDHDVPVDRVEYLRHGFHPWGNLRMDAKGNTVERPRSDDYDAMTAWEEDVTLLPGVPPPLRHWIGRSGLLGPDGVALLRPMRAVWWA